MWWADFIDDVQPQCTNDVNAAPLFRSKTVTVGAAIARSTPLCDAEKSRSLSRGRRSRRSSHHRSFHTSGRRESTCSQDDSALDALLANDLIGDRKSEIIAFLESHSIPFEEEHTCFAAECQCHAAADDESDLRAFIHFHTGYFFCEVCSVEGEWSEFRAHILSAGKVSHDVHSFAFDSSEGSRDLLEKANVTKEDAIYLPNPKCDSSSGDTPRSSDDSSSEILFGNDSLTPERHPHERCYSDFSRDEVAAAGQTYLGALQFSSLKRIQKNKVMSLFKLQGVSSKKLSKYGVAVSEDSMHLYFPYFPAQVWKCQTAWNAAEKMVGMKTVSCVKTSGRKSFIETMVPSLQPVLGVFGQCSLSPPSHLSESQSTGSAASDSIDDGDDFVLSKSITELSILPHELDCLLLSHYRPTCNFISHPSASFNDKSDLVLAAEALHQQSRSANQLSGFPHQILPHLERFNRVVVFPSFSQCLSRDQSNFSRVDDTSDDEQEQASVHQLACRLGTKRCFYVRPQSLFQSKTGDSSMRLPTVKPRSMVPSACLLAVQEGRRLRDLIKAPLPLNSSQIVAFSSLRNSVLHAIANPTELAGAQWTVLRELNDIMKGFRPGELTVLTGQTGCGKTTFISLYSLDLALRGTRTLWGSFEIGNAILCRTMLTQFALQGEKQLDAKDMREMDFSDAANRFEKVPINFMTFHGCETIDHVLETMHHSVLVHNTQHVIIDNLQFMMGSNDRAVSDRFLKQDRIISLLRQFATSTGCHVTLVIHPRKEKHGEMLSVNSIFGSARATQEADNIIVLQSKVSSAEKKSDEASAANNNTHGAKNGGVRRHTFLEVLKNRFDGTLGRLYMRFNPTSLSYRLYPVNSLKVPGEKEQAEVEQERAAHNLQYPPPYVERGPAYGPDGRLYDYERIPPQHLPPLPPPYSSESRHSHVTHGSTSARFDPLSLCRPWDDSLRRQQLLTSLDDIERNLKGSGSGS